LKTLGWTPAFAGETNLRHRPFSSFRRKPESSGIEEEFDVYTITALLVISAASKQKDKFDLKVELDPRKDGKYTLTVTYV
jgi:hypothetical protein